MRDSAPARNSQEPGKVVISHPLGRDFVSQLKAVDDTVVPHDLPERDELERLVQVGQGGFAFVHLDSAGFVGIIDASVRCVVLLVIGVLHGLSLLGGAIVCCSRGRGVRVVGLAICGVMLATCTCTATLSTERPDGCVAMCRPGRCGVGLSVPLHRSLPSRFVVFRAVGDSTSEHIPPPPILQIDSAPSRGFSLPAWGKTGGIVAHALS